MHTEKVEYQGRLKMSIILAVLGGRFVSTGGLAEQLPQPCRNNIPVLKAG